MAERGVCICVCVCVSSAAVLTMGWHCAEASGLYQQIGYMCQLTSLIIHPTYFHSDTTEKHEWKGSGSSVCTSVSPAVINCIFSKGVAWPAWVVDHDLSFLISLGNRAYTRAYRKAMNDSNRICVCLGGLLDFHSAYDFHIPLSSAITTYLICREKVLQSRLRPVFLVRRLCKPALLH